MSVCISNFDKNNYVNALSEELRNDIMIAVENKLSEIGLKDDEFRDAWDNAFNSKVCDLEDTIAIELDNKKLSFYVIDNLRAQQDGQGSFNLTRFDRLEDAVKAFNELPENYTSALGGSLTGGEFGVGEIDLIHRKNGESVLINDFKSTDRWDNALVRRAVAYATQRLGVERESDLRMFNKSVLVPLQPWEPQSLNSYFMDKYLRPAEGAEHEVHRKYGDLSMYSASNPVHYEHLRSAVSEVLVGGQGWITGEDFFKRLDSIDEYASPERLKVEALNVNYVDMNGRIGQADIKPHEFVLLRQQTIERSAQHPKIDEQINMANKVRQHNMEKGKKKSKDKDRDEEVR